MNRSNGIGPSRCIRCAMTSATVISAPALEGELGDSCDQLRENELAYSCEQLRVDADHERW